MNPSHTLERLDIHEELRLHTISENTPHGPAWTEVISNFEGPFCDKD